MSFTSIQQICDEFQIEDTLDAFELQKKLVQMQRALCLDDDEPLTGEKLIHFTKIDEAIDFSRKHKASMVPNETSMVPIAWVNELVQLHKGDTESPLDKIEKKHIAVITSTYSRIKKSFLYRKITVGSIIAVLTFVWSFPSVLTKNPFLEHYFNLNGEYINRYFYFFFTMGWLWVVFLLVLFLAFTFLKQKRIEKVVDYFKNIDNQFELFSRFMALGKKCFMQKDLEQYIVDKSIFLQLPEERLPKEKRGEYVRRKRFVLEYTNEIIPIVAEMIIQRALDRGVIKKSETPSWYDEFTFVDK